MTSPDVDTDVVVVGGGNAALCAALSAREGGARVVLVERAPEAERGGNTAFTGGVMRFIYNGTDDLRALLPDVSDDELAGVDFRSLSIEDYLQAVAQTTEYRADPDLAELLVKQSYEAVRWMFSNGVRFVPNYGRQAIKVGDKLVFNDTTPLEISGGGLGLVESLYRAAEREGVDVRYKTRAVALHWDSDRVAGVVVRSAGNRYVIRARSVILAAGGFQANAAWRAQYLGPGWDLAKVRGTRFNTGDGIAMALDAGAMPYGHWSGCHAISWDLNAPLSGDLKVGDGFSKHYYMLGIMVNGRGERFVDEGADIRMYTYAKYGSEVLRQPGQFAWQVFDQKVADLLRRETYRARHVTSVTANTLEELADRMEGVDKQQFLRTVAEYNAAVDDSVPFDFSVKDGRGTKGLTIPKSNWANRIEEPPFEAFGVTCGITFTFGGVRINTDAEVVDTEGEVIDGLFACGEMAGGLFYGNYPGGSGLIWGTVLGRIAGRRSAALVGAR